MGKGISVAHRIPASSRPAASPFTTERAGAIGRILVVDGDPDTLQSVACTLQHEGYFTAAAFDSAGAMQVFDRLSPFELLIVGLHLTPVNGVALAQALRRRSPDLQVLYLTNCRDALLATDLSISPDDEVIEQPFSDEELIETVSALQYRHRRLSRTR